MLSSPIDNKSDISINFFILAFGEYKWELMLEHLLLERLMKTYHAPDGTGQVFTPNFSILGATLARKLTENTSVGLNATPFEKVLESFCYWSSL